MTRIWVCDICGEVYNLADVDPEWIAAGCPTCHEETGGIK